MSNSTSSDSDSSASSMTSGSDSLAAKSSNSTASSAPEEHPIKHEYHQWGVHDATHRACQKAYEAEAASAMKDIIKEYKKWQAEHESELWKWFKSCGEDEEPDF
ncbi:uncharacterized protein ARMOST_11572 [Armillaria ostoyae]|uniref:Uncharacterized protein n=1 Tax=Armillaria ostoyae TaxID=47428 RepID=A0A284RHH4_ARMOS|nr:uncharacterized protein ARMOST_11572 [Armillaria ostoyae]